MSRQRTLTRLKVLEAQAVVGVNRELISRLAEEFGIDEGEFMAEAQRFATLFHQEGLTTRDQQLAHVASEMGITVEELQLEIDGTGS